MWILLQPGVRNLQKKNHIKIQPANILLIFRGKNLNLHQNKDLFASLFAFVQNIKNV